MTQSTRERKKIITEAALICGSIFLVGVAYFVISKLGEMDLPK